MSRRCDAIGCSASVQSGRFMCINHWRMVPVEFQRSINARYRACRKDFAFFSDLVYLQACVNALDYIANAEGKQGVTTYHLRNDVGCYESEMGTFAMPSFPCLGYAVVKSFQCEALQPIYLQARDLFSMLGRFPQSLTETVTWIPVAIDLPDADTTVNVQTIDCNEPVWLGYWNGECWNDVEGVPISVSHWAPMLKGRTA